MSGNNSRNVRPRIYQVLELQHHDPDRCIPLHVTRMKAGSERFFKQMSGMIDLWIVTLDGDEISRPICSGGV